MKKNRIIYSLYTRGMYSELFNLCLAIVYANHNQKKLKVNTWLWNSRIKKGWEDYFEPTLACSNNPFSAQDKVYTNEKPWFGKIYYKPKEFFSFYSYHSIYYSSISCTLNLSILIEMQQLNV